MVEQAVFARLSTFAGLGALVGARVYPVELPQPGPLPAVTYQRVSAVRARAMGKNPGLVTARVETDAWARDYAVAKAVAEQVRLALERWRGTLAGVEVLDSFLDEEEDDYEPETKRYAVRQDYLISFREAQS